jgi:hypothetical protein
MSYTDTTTGETIDGKAYLLRSTDGEETVDPARLFLSAEVMAELAGQVVDLTARVVQLEAALTEPVAEQGPED